MFVVGDIFEEEDEVVEVVEVVEVGAVGAVGAVAATEEEKWWWCGEVFRVVAVAAIVGMPNSGGISPCVA